MLPVFLSYFLEETTPVYGGAEGSIKITQLRSIANGDNSNNLAFHFPGHVGTHIDFPLHFSINGRNCSDYPADFWVFNRVGFANCSIDELETYLPAIASDIELLICKTGFGARRGERIYWEQQPVISADLAAKLRSRFPNLRVFGFDMISLTSKLNREEGKKAHLQFLLENNILILEDMNLSNLFESPAKVIIAPLLVKQADGVPCTVIASPE